MDDTQEKRYDGGRPPVLREEVIGGRTGIPRVHIGPCVNPNWSTEPREAAWRAKRRKKRSDRHQDSGRR